MKAKNRKKEMDFIDQRDGQTLWTLLVALGVLIAAIYHIGTPTEFITTRNASRIPEAVKTGNPVLPQQVAGPEAKLKSLNQDRLPAGTSS